MLWNHEFGYLPSGVGVTCRFLDGRITHTLGHIGTHDVTTDSMASDQWHVHWAENARAAAKPVIGLAFRADLSVLVRWFG